MTEWVRHPSGPTRVFTRPAHRQHLDRLPTGESPRGRIRGFNPRSRGKSGRMEIVGILVIILLVVMIIYFIRRA
jgi:hypothetical protein